jgi:hypothetical protein
MAQHYFCEDKRRRQEVDAHATLNGIDYLEVLDLNAPAGSPRQQTLLVHCLKPIPALTAANVFIEGGVRITPVRIVWAHRANAVPASLLTPAEQVAFLALPDADRTLIVRTDSSGDFATYTLSLRQSVSDPTPPDDFDPLLSRVPFSFKVECPSDFDCAEEEVCLPERLPAPQINYLAKDYASFRRLILDRLAVTMPDWQERSPADLGIVLVELLAYAGDYLSYYQDAVATEAYLGTARRRSSVRRHARLLDYRMHDGCNSRAWVFLEVEAGSAADGFLLPAGSRLYTRVNAARGGLDPADADGRLLAGAEPYETMHDLTLHAELNEIAFYTWGDQRCCLPKGATQATLDGSAAELPLQQGDLLLLEEVIGPETGNRGDADVAHRHVVRLDRSPEERVDPLTGDTVLDIAWDIADALPFPLCVWQVDDGSGGRRPVGVARGNVALADAGETLEDQSLLPEEAAASGRYQPQLRHARLTHAVPYEADLARSQPAATAITQDARAALPAVSLSGEAETWQPQPDLLDSDRFSPHFVVEMDEEGRARLRFGDGSLGRRPLVGTRFAARYRLGNGPDTRVGAEAIAHVLTDRAGIRNVRNPLPSQGGVAPEPLEQVRLYAPQAFRRQERAVTPADYAAFAQRHPEVQKAQATQRWTGSWHTLFITIDRKGGLPVDADFEEEVRTFLGRYRLAGHDLEIDGPRFVPLDIALNVCLEEGAFRDVVYQALLERFSSRARRGGERGFFHPDNFTFGQTVYLSPLLAAIMEIAGVRWVEPVRFQRWGKAAAGEIAAGRLLLNRLEIARLDNDPNFAENGRIELILEGGL